MALIIRIDVDRPYGKQPFFRHILSRVASDLYLPKIEKFGYLNELKLILELLNEQHARSYVFFRRCTLPSEPVLGLLRDGGHEVGLHLEDSRSFDTFAREKEILEQHLGERVFAVSKHGSGGAKYGYHHYAPYEPEKYITWAKQSGMRLFFGNLENPGLKSSVDEDGFCIHPSAFWLEPAWRDVNAFTIDWLVVRAKVSDIVLLLHPENILADPVLLTDFKRLLLSLETRILE